MKVLVTGIGGGIGLAVAEVLGKNGYQILGYALLVTHQEQIRWVERQHVGCTTDIEKVSEVVRECDSVVHLAGWVHRLARNEEEKRKVFEINTKATANIAKICKENGKKLVFASTVAVYGDDVSGELTEDTPTAPSTPYGESKLLAERHVLDAGGTVLRFPMVYGANDRGNMARMIRAIKKGWFVVPGKGKATRTFCCRWNAAEAIRLCLEKEEARGKVYLVTDEEDTTLGELADKIARLSGVRKPFRVPRPLIAGGALAGSVLKRLARRGMPLDWSSYSKLVRDLSFDGSKIRRELGYKPLKTLEEGLKEEIDWLAEEEGKK